MRFPSPTNEPLTDLPEKLLEDVREGGAVFFIGSSFLKPPRYEHLKDITDLITDAIREYNSKRDIVIEYPVDRRIKFFDELLNELEIINGFLAKYGTSKNITKTVKTFLNSLNKIIPSPTKNVENEARNIKDEAETLRKQIANIIDQIEEQKRNYTEITKTAKLGPTYDKLRSYLEVVWPISNTSSVHDLMANLGKVNSLITTIFDTNIENNIKNMGKRVRVVTGVESLSSDSTVDTTSYDFLLYKILGTIDKPDTLRLSSGSSSDDVTMASLRDKFKNSDHAKFLLGLIRDKTLVLLGYTNVDIFDSFFRELFNDLSYRSERLTKDMYFVNVLTYDTYVGLWGHRDENDIKIIALHPDIFIAKLLEGVRTATE